MVTKAVCVLTNSYTKKKINGYILPNLMTSYRSKKLYLGKG